MCALPRKQNHKRTKKKKNHLHTPVNRGTCLVDYSIVYCVYWFQSMSVGCTVPCMIVSLSVEEFRRKKKKSVTKEEIKKIDHNKSWNQHFRRVRSCAPSKSHRRHVRRWNGKAFWPPVSLPLSDVDRDYGPWIRMKSKATGSVLPLGADWSIRWKVIGGCVLKRATGAEQLLAGRFYILIWDPAQLCGDAGSHGEPDSSWFQDKSQGRLERSANEETKRHFGRNIHQIDTTKVTSPFILGKKRRTAKKSH